jgi:hypothetical protein
MTAEEFNEKQFNIGDRIIVTFLDGRKEEYDLYQGNAISGLPAKESYTGGPGRPETKDRIVVISANPSGTDGIDLDIVQNVEATLEQ